MVVSMLELQHSQLKTPLLCIPSGMAAHPYDTEVVYVLLSKGPIWILATKDGKKKEKIDLFPPLLAGGCMVATPNTFIIADGKRESSRLCWFFACSLSENMPHDRRGIRQFNG